MQLLDETDLFFLRVQRRYLVDWVSKRYELLSKPSGDFSSFPFSMWLDGSYCSRSWQTALILAVSFSLALKSCFS